MRTLGRKTTGAHMAKADTGGEFMFAVLTKLTIGVFKHVLKVN
jgi:hypothetical protein